MLLRAMGWRRENGPEVRLVSRVMGPVEVITPAGASLPTMIRCLWGIWRVRGTAPTPVLISMAVMLRTQERWNFGIGGCIVEEGRHGGSAWMPRIEEVTMSHLAGFYLQAEWTPAERG